MVKTMTELTNIAELFEKPEYKDTLIANRELVKVADALDMPLIITGYKEDTMPDRYKEGDKECFRMDFYFADDEKKTKHYIRTEARYLWDYLRAVNSVNPAILTSGTLVAIIRQGQKKNGKLNNKFYYFAGTMSEEDE